MSTDGDNPINISFLIADLFKIDKKK